tara:strand:- start:2766 stop:3023 length:258 start_codon:yes stop_codon:yes gene_type:complete
MSLVFTFTYTRHKKCIYKNKLTFFCKVRLAEPLGDKRMNGKGSKQRPTNKAAFDSNFDNIFGKKDKPKVKEIKKAEKKDERKVDE